MRCYLIIYGGKNTVDGHKKGNHMIIDARFNSETCKDDVKPPSLPMTQHNDDVST